ncbi:uncharacterized protein VTP21DRAFT_9794 [Calcarisporiella thermophila]|uniref:uncharacterized protein n=1 Tax=Calcarisporiella thermophila TaxID=911321 RepID=UPI003742C9A2
MSSAASQIDPDLIANFCAITGSEPDRASEYLAITDGQLDQAINFYMENGGASLQPQASHTTSTSATASHTIIDDDDSVREVSPPPRPNIPPPTNVGDYDFSEEVVEFESDEAMARRLEAIEQEEASRREARRKESSMRAQELRENGGVRAPIAPRREVLTGDPMMDFAESSGESFGFGRQGVMITPGMGVRPIGPNRIFDQDESMSFDAFGSGADNAEEDKYNRLARLFRPPFDIMAKTGFEQTRDVAKQEGKWLLVNVQDLTDFTCQVLNRDLWSNETVKDIIREHFLFLQFGSTTPEGRKFLSFYPTTSYPYITILDPRTGELVKKWNVGMTPEEFLIAIADFLDSHSLVGGSKSKQKGRARDTVTPVKDVSEMTEEEQINAALAASLAESSGGYESGSSARESRDAMEVEAEDMEDNVFDAIKPVKRDEPTDPATSTRIQFRLPDGSRIIRRFSKQDPVRAIFEFIKAEVPQADVTPFELVFNRQQLINQVGQTIEEAGLSNAAVSLGWH